MDLKKVRAYKTKYYNKGYSEASRFFTKEIRKMNAAFSKSIKIINKSTEKKNEILDRKIDNVSSLEKMYAKRLYTLQVLFNHLKIEDHKTLKLRNSLVNKIGALKDTSFNLDQTYKKFLKEFLQ